MGEISYGFAKYLRDTLPSVNFVGFTGTPIEASDVDIYDFSRAENESSIPF